jgi:hypothetical protein
MIVIKVECKDALRRVHERLNAGYGFLRRCWADPPMVDDQLERTLG